MEKFDISRIDAHALRILVSVFDNGSISRAADDFELNQSTVSHTIDKLRKAIGDPLFVRSGRDIIATKHTEALIPRAREILAMLEGLAHPEEMTPHPDEQAIIVAGNVTALMPQFQRLLALIKVDFPDARVRLLEAGSRANLERQLNTDEAEIVVTTQSPSYPPTVHAQPIIRSDLAVFYDASMRGPVTTVEEYCTARHVVLDFGGNRKSIVSQALEQQSMYRNVAVGISNAHALSQIVKGSDMIATMLQVMAESCLDDLAWSPPPMPLPSVTFDAAWHLRNEHAPRNIWLRKLVAEAFKDPVI